MRNETKTADTRGIYHFAAVLETGDEYVARETDKVRPVVESATMRISIRAVDQSEATTHLFNWATNRIKTYGDTFKSIALESMENPNPAPMIGSAP